MSGPWDVRRVVSYAAVAAGGAVVGATVEHLLNSDADMMSASTKNGGSIGGAGAVFAWLVVGWTHGAQTPNRLAQLGSVALASAATTFLGTTVVRRGDLFNTVDYGLNRIEQEDFTGQHERRLLTAAAATGGGAVAFVGGMLGTVVLVARRRGVGGVEGLTPASAAASGAAVGAVGAMAGLIGATLVTAKGQQVPYRPFVTDVDGVSAALWDGVSDDEAAQVTVDRAVLDGPPQPEGRLAPQPAQARFYVSADAAGNGDGELTGAELRAHVATFDADGNGSIDWEGEWSKLHAAVVE